MGKIYVNQTNLILNFDLGADITSGTVVIQGKNPKGVDIDNLAVTIIDAISGKVRYESPAIPAFAMVGVYKLWAFVTFANGKSICGEVCALTINQKGT